MEKLGDYIKKIMVYKRVSKSFWTESVTIIYTLRTTLEKQHKGLW